MSTIASTYPTGSGKRSVSSDFSTSGERREVHREGAADSRSMSVLIIIYVLNYVSRS